MRTSHVEFASEVVHREFPLTAEQLRQTIEALLLIEGELPTSNPRWSELRMVRKVLGRMLVEAEEAEQS